MSIMRVENEKWPAGGPLLTVIYIVFNKAYVNRGKFIQNKVTDLFSRLIRACNWTGNLREFIISIIS